MKARGWPEVSVRIIPAASAVVNLKPSTAGVEAEISAYAANGETLGTKALNWAKSSPWWEDDITHAVTCLGSDLEDGNGNGASITQATLFLKRLTAAMSRAPKIEVQVTPETPQQWEIVCGGDIASPDTDSAETFGASSGSDGWRCD